jgi:hypothetical protein
MTVLYYYLFINKGILKSIRENILCSKSVWKVLVNIIYGAISFNAIPLSYSWFLVYLNNWIAMSSVSSGVIENKVIAFMLLCFLIISFIDIVGMLLITVLGTATLAFMILARFFDELFDRERQNENRKRLKHIHKSLTK